MPTSRLETSSPSSRPRDYDAVIGNPPYVRYQDFSGEARRPVARGRARSRRATHEPGLVMGRLHGALGALPKPGGRLGLVLPAELLTVNYAAEVRRFLMDRFRSRRPHALPGARLPGGTRRGRAPHGRRLREGADGPLPHLPGSQRRRTLRRRRAAPLEAVQSRGQVDAVAPLHGGPGRRFAKLESSDDFTELETWGDTTLGHGYRQQPLLRFALPQTASASYASGPADLVPLSPPGSRHLRGLTFTSSALDELGALAPRPGSSGPLTSRRTAAATTSRLASAPTSTRPTSAACGSPGGACPWSPRPIFSLTYMNADTPRLCTNRARVHHLNSVHGVYLKPELPTARHEPAPARRAQLA